MKQTEQMRKLVRDISLLAQCMERFWAWVTGRVAPPCALCAEYHVVRGHGSGERDDCTACPIREDGHDHCAGTPYLTSSTGPNGEWLHRTTRDGGLCPGGLTAGDAAAELAYLAGLQDRLAARVEAEKNVAAKAVADAATEGVRWYSLWLQGLMTREELTTKMRQAAGLSDAPKVPADAAAEDEMRIMKRRLGRLVEAFLFYVPPESGDLYNRHELVRADKEAIWRELGLTEGEMLKGGEG